MRRAHAVKSFVLQVSGFPFDRDQTLLDNQTTLSPRNISLSMSVGSFFGLLRRRREGEGDEFQSARRSVVDIGTCVGGCGG